MTGEHQDPGRVVRDYVDRNGETEVTTDALLSTWGYADWSEESRRLITHALADVGLRSIPSLEEAQAGGRVRIVPSEPAPPAGQAPWAVPEHRRRPPDAQPTGAPKRRRRLIVITALGALLLVGGGVAAAFLLAADDGSELKEGSPADGASSRVPPEPEGTGELQTNEAWSDVWNSGAELNSGDPVRLAGRVYQGGGGFLLMYADIENDELPTQVFGTFEGVGEDDFVLVKGEITGGDTYETVAGGEVDVVTIDATSVKPISEARATEISNPAVGGSRKLNLTKTRSGLRVTLRSISWTDDATRVKLRVTNGTGSKATLSTYDATIQQGPKQYGIKEEGTAANPLDDDLRPGVTVEGTLTFDRIDQRRGKGFLELEWLSDDFDIDSDKPFDFTMAWRP